MNKRVLLLFFSFNQKREITLISKTYKQPSDFSHEICFLAVRVRVWGYSLKKVRIRKSCGMLILGKKIIIQLESVISLLRERANGSFVRGI